ncbi:2-keto-4-pentenoate hydratase [Pseudonocardia hispaniensis]|uniref:2-keto-4-pentenoate hydratase n=1 Tax=Pseudonocardia hispaniensis TaxID=904933 RepID=A0ABW1IZ82_9PSEU
MTDVVALASMLDDAARTATAIPQLTATTSLTLDKAYDVQRAGVALRTERGDAAVGVKLGFTSKAKALQMGVSDAIIGVITDEMRVDDGGEVDVSRLIHPRIEPEVAFRLGPDIDPDDPHDDPQTAVLEIAPALEIIDSRYRDFTFSLEDVVADNTSAARFVVGPWRPFESAQARLDLGNLGVVLELDGAVVETGSTAAILGDPLRALPAVKRMARHHGLALPAGSIILAGAATAAVSLPSQPGISVVATVTGLGRVCLTTVGGDVDG